MFSFPIFSYEFAKEYYIGGYVNWTSIIKNSTKSLLVLGPIYAIASAYLMYYPKETYLKKLEYYEDLNKTKAQSKMKLEK